MSVTMQEAQGMVRAADAADAPGPDDETVGGSITPPAPKFVYALGRISVKAYGASLQQEINRLMALRNPDLTRGKSYDQVLFELLSERGNRYIARQLCYFLSIEKMSTYIVQARYAEDIDALIAALEPRDPPEDIDVVVGVLGPLATPEMCGGQVLPIVVFDRIYSFSRLDLLSALATPPQATDDAFLQANNELLDRVMQIADNAGALDEHRALNFLVLGRSELYRKVFDCQQANRILTAIETRPSRIGAGRRVIDVILVFTDRNNEFVEKWFMRVDVTEEFPFVVTKMSRYFDR